jgi:hypothetical protein
MSDKDQDLSLEDLGDLELSADSALPDDDDSLLDSSDDLSLDEGMDLGAYGDLEDDQALEESDELLDEDDSGLSLSGDELLEDFGELDLSGEEEDHAAPSADADAFTSIKLLDGDEMGDDNDFSEDAKEKLKEIDEIMESTSSQLLVASDLGFDDEEEEEEIPVPEKHVDSNINEPLVSDDLDLDSLDFSAEESRTDIKRPEAQEDKSPKKNKKKEAPPVATGSSESFKEVSGAYTMEMERTQATIANLRADREELLSKIQNLEEGKLLQNRQVLTMRAELDEKKIELTIMRRKLNEEIGELKDRMHLHDEKRLLLEERNKILTQELDRATQKNKIDVKKVQMRERELEQRLELLKSDADSQIKHRDLKILELKRKIDAMEFDMESISQQEKRSVESRFELEDKLDKAIKTLRGAITVLENESDKNHVLETLKKNIDM